MKRTKTLGWMLALGMLALPAAGGEKGAERKEARCSAEATACLRFMVGQFKERGWVGIDLGHSEDEGATRINMVIPGSPAEEAGFQSGDLLVALNGIAYTEENKEAIKENYAAFRPGNTVTFRVRRGTEEKDIEVRLAPIPDHVMAQWIGQHMIEQHTEPPQEVADKP